MEQIEKTNIRVERARKQISQEELAKEVGVSRQAIHNIETGKSKPVVSLAILIARFFGKKVEEMF